jgi:hypothetical protein
MAIVGAELGGEPSDLIVRAPQNLLLLVHLPV